MVAKTGFVTLYLCSIALDIDVFLLEIMLRGKTGVDGKPHRKD